LRPLAGAAAGVPLAAHSEQDVFAVPDVCFTTGRAVEGCVWFGAGGLVLQHRVCSSNLLPCKFDYMKMQQRTTALHQQS